MTCEKLANIRGERVENQLSRRHFPCLDVTSIFCVFPDKLVLRIAIKNVAVSLDLEVMY